MAAKKKKASKGNEKDVQWIYNAGFGDEPRPNISQATARKWTGFQGPAGSRIVQIVERGQPKEWGGGTRVTLWARANKSGPKSGSKTTPKGVTSAMPSTKTKPKPSPKGRGGSTKKK